MSNVDNSVKQRRDFGIVTYLDKDTVQAVLDKHTHQIKKYAYIVHDLDITDTHIHILLYLYNPNTYNAVKNWFPKVQNTFAKPIIDNQGALAYLTHLDEDDKTLYNEKDIVSYNFNFDNTKDTNHYSDILEDMLNKVPLRVMAKRYGKDFIYHYKQYKELAEDIRFEESIPKLIPVIDEQLNF